MLSLQSLPKNPNQVVCLLSPLSSLSLIPSISYLLSYSFPSYCFLSLSFSNLSLFSLLPSFPFHCLPLFQCSGRVTVEVESSMSACGTTNISLSAIGGSNNNYTFSVSSFTFIGFLLSLFLSLISVNR